MAWKSRVLLSSSAIISVVAGTWLIAIAARFWLVAGQQVLP